MPTAVRKTASPRRRSPALQVPCTTPGRIRRSAAKTGKSCPRRPTPNAGKVTVAPQQEARGENDGVSDLSERTRFSHDRSRRLDYKRNQDVDLFSRGCSLVHIVDLSRVAFRSTIESGSAQAPSRVGRWSARDSSIHC